ncbi:hypothetical protein V2J09_014677 [Rumex salicifolius]
MDLDFEKYCKVDESPRTVLQSSHHHPKHENKSRKSKSSSRNSQVSLEAGFKEIKFRNYHRSFSCKTLPTKNSELAVDREVLKRGSVYQCSKDRKSFKRPDDIGGRKKIELSLSGNSPFSFSLLDSICGSDEEEEPEQEPLTSSNIPPQVQSSRNSKSVKFVNRGSSTSKPAERDFMENSKFKSHEVVGPSSSGNILKDDDNQALRKSLSSKLALPHSPTHSGSDVSKGSSVSRFTPIRKMLDPLTKSKSHKSPMNSKLVNGVVKPSSGLTGSGKNKTVQKSLLCDLSSATPNVEKDHENILVPSSAAHLHGDIKLEHKHGVSYFELSLAHSDIVLVAKTWKADDALNWFYTFHSVQSRKKSNASGWGVKYSIKDSPIVGQMHVSCHLCSELKEGGTFSNSMMTEFVLYDVLHPTKGFSAEESDVVESHASNEGLTSPIKLKNQAANAIELCNLDLLAPCAAKDLHPRHELAAMVIKVPFEKRESLKHRSSDTFTRQAHLSLLDLSLAEQTSMGNKTHNITSTTVCVVTPFGNHSLPTCESRGPSPLLDRWRLGGHCDCGGWDMACPLNVLDNLRTKCKEEKHSLLQGDQPFSLHFQSAKEKSPALTIKLTRKGQYSVDFHAQMSALQALAICIAILHTTEEDSLDLEKHRQLLQCSSMKMFIEDKVKLLIEAVTEEDKGKMVRADEDHPSSFALDPPFSPIARV